MTTSSNPTTTISLPSDLQIMMSRDFEAPRDLVYQVVSDPAQIPNWWGPRYLTSRVDRWDFRVGGSWRIVQVTPDGQELAFRGDYLEIDPPSKIVQTFEFEPMAGQIATETMTLEEIDGKTRMSVVSLFDSVEARDGMLNSGMEGGAVETHDRLAELLASLQGK